jgi:hypothetical protein
MHARLDRAAAAAPQRARLDRQISADARAVAALPARQAYLDGEQCGVRADGITSFSMIRLASDAVVAPEKSDREQLLWVVHGSARGKAGAVRHRLRRLRP